MQSLQVSSIETIATFDNLDTLATFDTFYNSNLDLKKFLISKNQGSQNLSFLKFFKGSPDSVDKVDNVDIVFSFLSDGFPKNTFISVNF